MTTPQLLQLRQLYRSLLRELPRRTSSAQRSPLQASLRRHLLSKAQSQQLQTQSGPADRSWARYVDEVQQLVQYARAQRTYTILLDRYNPGADMSETERVRLTARRVGMDLPVEAAP